MLQRYEKIRTHANYFAKKARAGGRHLSARHVPDISQLGGMYLVVTCMHFRRRSGVVLQLLQCYSSFLGYAMAIYSPIYIYNIYIIYIDRINFHIFIG